MPDAGQDSTSSPSTRSARWRWTRCKRPTRGHPGTPMALAPVAYTLWQQFLRYDPDDPIWPNRDRFVLSCGHASMLLYSMLHLAGVQAVDHEVRADRRAGRAARRHQALPPAGQPVPGPSGVPLDVRRRNHDRSARPGRGNSVGMAIAPRWLAAHFNRPGFELFDFNVYALCSDGDMMEGVSNEAASLAGHLKLSNLCWIYDDNHITIEGNTDAGLQRRRGHAVQGLRLERHPRGRRQRYRPLLDGRIEAFSEHDRPADADHRPTATSATARRTSRTPARARRAAGRRRNPLTKEVYGWPEDAKFLVPDEVVRAFQRRRSAARPRSCARPGMAKFAEVCQASIPSWPTQWQRMQTPRAARRLGHGRCRLSRRRQGHGHARLVAAKCSTPSPSTCRG